jgi:hypothetical protein
MNMFKDDMDKEFSRIKTSMENGQPLTYDDLKLILLSELNEEDLHESK